MSTGLEWKMSPSFNWKVLRLDGVYFLIALFAAAPMTASRSPQMNRRESVASVSPSAGERTAGGDVWGPRSAFSAGHHAAPVEAVMSYRTSGEFPGGIGRTVTGLV